MIRATLLIISDPWIIFITQGLFVISLIAQATDSTLVRFELVLVAVTVLSFLLLGTALVSHRLGNKAGFDLYTLSRQDLMARLEGAEQALRDKRVEVAGLRESLMVERTENVQLRTLLETFKGQLGSLQLELDDCRDKRIDNR